MSGTVSTLRIFAFVQARLGSSRLPKKVLSTFPLDNREEVTLVELIYLRLLRVLPKENIYFLIPDSPEEEELKSYLESKSISYYAGDLEDVRERYLQAGRQLNADVILRLTGDNPFPDTSAIESIIEAWHYSYIHNIPIDLCYVSPLPLGMGIESFRLDSLENSLGWKETHHREHVSLAIKENPDRFRIVKIPSFYNSIPTGIRMTVDEPTDRNTICQISRKLIQESKESSSAQAIDWNTDEFLFLYSREPELFHKNETIQQVRFPLPPHPPRKESVLIIFADPRKFGTGHRVRMEILASHLSVEGYGIEFLESPDTEGIAKFSTTKNSDTEKAPVVSIQFPSGLEKVINLSPRFLIVDSRDIRVERINKTGIYRSNSSFQVDPVIPREAGAKTLYLDNYHPSRLESHNPESIYIDLLPHPNSLSWFESPSILIPETTKQMIYSKRISTKKNQHSERKTISRKTRLLVYSGSLSGDSLSDLDKALVEYFPDWDILRVGSGQSEWIPRKSRLTKREWFSWLDSCDCFLSYFGQGLLEAIAWEKPVASFSISEVHENLSNYLQDSLGIPHWGNLTNWDDCENHQKDMDKSPSAISHLENFLPLGKNCFRKSKRKIQMDKTDLIIQSIQNHTEL